MLHDALIGAVIGGAIGAVVGLVIAILRKMRAPQSDDRDEETDPDEPLDAEHR
jgi:hypothetical protein